MSELKQLFKENYKGMIESEFGEDFAMYRNLRKNVRSYFKKPHYEKVGAIYNKILLCTRFFHKDFLYEHLTSCMDDDRQNEFMIFMIQDCFDISYMSYNVEIDDMRKKDVMSFLNNINN